MLPTGAAWQEPGRVEVRPWALQAGLHKQVSAPQGRGARASLLLALTSARGSRELFGQEELLWFVSVFPRCQLYLLDFTHQ